MRRPTSPRYNVPIINALEVQRKVGMNEYTPAAIGMDLGDKTSHVCFLSASKDVMYRGKVKIFDDNYFSPLTTITFPHRRVAVSA